MIAFAALAVLGQYAVYRARRYRLTRTIYRGLRFHQGGSASAYALRAVLWWIATALTFGLTYPFQLASLERYKMRNTYYGNLAGHFAGSGLRLLLRGLPMWLLVIAPLALTVGARITVVDWKALGDALSAGGDDVMSRIEGGNPALAGVIVFAMLMAGTAVTLAVLLYPAFQALVLRWWASGLGFGELSMTSTLRMRHVYGAYVRFLWYGLLFCIVLAVLGTVALVAIGLAAGSEPTGTAGEIAATGLLLAGYVIAALGSDHLSRHRAAVALAVGHGIAAIVRSLWLDRVKASGTPSSALGEGLADALNVGGYSAIRKWEPVSDKIMRKQIEST